MKKQGPQKFVQVDYDIYFSLSSFLVSRIYFICGFLGFTCLGFFWLLFGFLVLLVLWLAVLDFLIIVWSFSHFILLNYFIECC